MGNKIIDDLINALDSSDESTQVYAIEDLCDFKDERIVTTH